MPVAASPKPSVAQIRRFPVRLLAILTLICPGVDAQQLDLLIRGGSVIDGSGSPAISADIGILADRIVFVGASAGRTAKRTIDATGLVVTPGFIDPHTHTAADLSDPKHARNEAYLMQGVTTVATGNDGASPLNTAATLAQWSEQGIGTNAVLFIGQGTVRREVMGMSDAKPTPEQMDRMKALVDRAMSEGAVGLSTGLYYTPGSYSSTEEVIELARVAAQHHGIYDTHMRDESSYSIGLLASVKETIRIGREAHLPVMISHIKALGADVWGQSAQVIALIDEARKAGVDVIASQYPYTASGTSVSSSLVPPWVMANGAMHKNLDDPAQHPHRRRDDRQPQTPRRRGHAPADPREGHLHRRQDAGRGRDAAQGVARRGRDPDRPGRRLQRRLVQHERFRHRRLHAPALGHDLLRRLRRPSPQVRDFPAQDPQIRV
jgi:N-acyl-D-aspartate/D-glutamate deacylase